MTGQTRRADCRDPIASPGVNEVTTSVPTDAGELRAIVYRPDCDGPVPGVVLVDGAGEGTADGWDRWPRAIAELGAVVLAHDKPGCGGSPGDWREQSFQDRGRETLAAVDVLRRDPGVDPARVGLLGISQGGWISYIAASLAPEVISQLVSVSGPGVSVVEQERYRIECAVNGDPDAMAWVDERTQRLLAGEDPESIISTQLTHADRPWFAAACDYYDEPEVLGMAARCYDFDPASVLPAIRCRVFAAFGGADTSVPVGRSAAILSSLLPPDPLHALAVFPGADHNLFIAEPDPNVDLADQLAPGFMHMLDAWLKA
jgi:pimeloyl-ACP methyl ester carboxylesterase